MDDCAYSDDEEEEDIDPIVLIQESKLKDLLSRNCFTEGCEEPCLIEQSNRGWWITQLIVPQLYSGLQWKAKLECSKGHVHQFVASNTVAPDGRSTGNLNLLMSLHILLSGCCFQQVSVRNHITLIKKTFSKLPLTRVCSKEWDYTSWMKKQIPAYWGPSFTLSSGWFGWSTSQRW